MLIAAVVLHVFSSDYEGPAFRSSTTGEQGASLLFDTLRHMGYPVRIGRSPINMGTDITHAHIIIQPHSSHFYQEKAEKIFDWVNSGGKLIFLHNSPSTIFDEFTETLGINFGSLTLYEIGDGMFVRGRANDITNKNLIDDAETGARLEALIYRWSVNRVVFAEYYHSPPAAETFFNRLPTIVRLVLVQLILLAVIIMWHLGKRFGNPIVYYQEQEREENEHVHALTRLYMKTRRRL